MIERVIRWILGGDSKRRGKPDGERRGRNGTLGHNGTIPHDPRSPCHGDAVCVSVPWCKESRQYVDEKRRRGETRERERERGVRTPRTSVPSSTNSLRRCIERAAEKRGTRCPIDTNSMTNKFAL